MDDNELADIRSRRLEEIQAQQKTPQGDQDKKRQEAAAKEDEIRNHILSQVLDQEARARLSNIALAKPDKARQLETMIINMARFGQIQGKLGDKQLKELLDKISEQTHKETTVKFDRRRAAIDSDED